MSYYGTLFPKNNSFGFKEVKMKTIVKTVMREAYWNILFLMFSVGERQRNLSKSSEEYFCKFIQKNTGFPILLLFSPEKLFKGICITNYVI